MADDQPFPSRGAPVGVATDAPSGVPGGAAPAASPPQARAPQPPPGQAAQPGAPAGEAPPTAPQPANPAQDAKRKGNRGRLFAILGVVVLLGAIGYGVYYVLIGSKVVATDDAYVGADVAQVTPQIAGTVQEVRVRDTEAVKAGDVLAVIDSADTRLAAAQATADYNRAERRVKQEFATNGSFGAAIGAREAEVTRGRAQLASAVADLERARIDLQRRQALSASGAVSGEELTNAKSALLTAQSNVAAGQAAVKLAEANVVQARAQEQAQTALTSGADVEGNPEVTAAKSALDTAKLNLERTVLKAPLDGVIARRQVQVGQRVNVGQQLMTVVPLEEAYVDANFKEVQLKKIRVGQPVTLKADAYGGVVFHGRVAGFAGGTGSAFAVIPAQNATGNWIKVVQRLPVRVRLDRDEIRKHPLQVGLSMHASVDVSGDAETRPRNPTP